MNQIQHYCAVIKTDAKTIEDVTKVFMEYMQMHKESLDIEIVSFEQLDWGTPEKPEIAQGWIQVTYFFLRDRE